MLCGSKGWERKRSRECPTSRDDPATDSPLPSAVRPAAVCCDSQRAAGLCHLASRQIPRTHIGNPKYAATSLRVLPLHPRLSVGSSGKGSALSVIPVALFLSNPLVMGSSGSPLNSGRGDGSIVFQMKENHLPNPSTSLSEGVWFSQLISVNKLSIKGPIFCQIHSTSVF